MSTAVSRLGRGTAPHASRPRYSPPFTLALGTVLVGLVVVMALLSFVWTPHDPLLMHPGDRLSGPTNTYWLGTDKFGRDTLSQIMVGARITLFVGVIAVGISALVGVPLGILAALGPSWLDGLLMRAADILLAFPALLIAIMLGAIHGGSTTSAMIAIGIAGVPGFFRVTRSGARRAAVTEYVQAARVAGRSVPAIARTHIWPAVRGLVVVQASVSFALAVLAEAALSFLGLGTPPPTPSWGRMLQESQELLFVDARLALVPGIAIAVAVLGFNLLGDGLRDLLDPHTRRSR